MHYLFVLFRNRKKLNQLFLSPCVIDFDVVTDIGGVIFVVTVGCVAVELPWWHPELYASGIMQG